MNISSKFFTGRKLAGAVRPLLLWLAINGSVTALWGQGTVRFGFEEYSVGATPPNISYDPENPFLGGPPVVRLGIMPLPAFEGRQFLGVDTEAFIASPDGLPIREFRLAWYMPDVTWRVIEFTAGNTDGNVNELDRWQILSGTFDPPVSAVRVSGLIQNGQTFGAFFGIDGVELVTVPEPGTGWLLALAIIGFTAATARGVRRSSRTGC